MTDIEKALSREELIQTITAILDNKLSNRFDARSVAISIVYSVPLINSAPFMLASLRAYVKLIDSIEQSPFDWLQVSEDIRKAIKEATAS